MPNIIYLMSVRAQRNNFAPQLQVSLHNVITWDGTTKILAIAGCIHFNALAIGDDALKNFINEISKVDVSHATIGMRPVATNIANVPNSIIIWLLAHAIVHFLKIPPVRLLFGLTFKILGLRNITMINGM